MSAVTNRTPAAQGNAEIATNVTHEGNAPSNASNAPNAPLTQRNVRVVDQPLEFSWWTSLMLGIPTERIDLRR